MDDDVGRGRGEGFEDGVVLDRGGLGVGESGEGGDVVGWEGEVVEGFGDGEGVVEVGVGEVDHLL